ncbi:beta-lactamase family protein [Streptomyces sp. MUM 203J]|uniref:serine hydrolase domain-containing protein n=1 Tax=Streptomyces sp. MUM 203J TaxID=2791990 RepID=UPI001F040C06|nr:serine hydrolase domain-containing protein [Streptomyces sp. MUM 203J]MCH0540241.1 beta-lactamase family protein [Streptomyces sp. MUM 203J]
MPGNRVRRSTAAIGALCGALLAVTTTAHAQTTADHPATSAALRTFQSAAGPGAAVHAGDGAAAWTLSAGTGTINTNRPIRSDEHFRAGSQTKTFTAATVLQLVDEGKVSLNEPIDTYLPGVVTGNGYDGTRITLRHLLQHTSGIAAYDPLASIALAEPDGTYHPATLVREGLKRAPVSAPGGGFRYSNTNYLILGMLIEKITGLPVHQAVTTRIIEPLDLTRTTFPAPGDRALPAPAVNGYHGTRIGPFFFWSPVISYDPSLFGSSGAVISTLEDITSFYQALLAGRVVSPASLAEMQNTGQPGSPSAAIGYGLGIFKADLSCGGTAWGHNGAVPGYHSQTLVTPDGRHASAATNAYLATNPPQAQLAALLDTALCEGREGRQP